MQKRPSIAVVPVAVVVIQLSACAHRVPAIPGPEPSLMVTIQLLTGEKQTLAPVTVRPEARADFSGLELPYSGNTTLTALSTKPTGRRGAVFVLYEGPGTIGSAVGLDVLEVGFPTDGNVAQYEAEPSTSVAPPCVARTAFFIKKFGGTRPDSVLVWYREGERRASFRFDSHQHTVALTPILRFDTRDIRLLRHKPSDYILTSEATVGSRDYLVLVVGRRRNRSFVATAFSSSRGRHLWSDFIESSDEDVQWSFYAVDDPPHLRNHCRGQ